MEHITVFSIGILTTAIVFLSMLRVAWKRRPKNNFPEQASFNNTFHSARWYNKLNLGAFVFTPFWLFINGFWVSALAYLLTSFYLPLIGLLISVFLFFNGSSLSWCDGRRWGNDVEAFLDEQLFWSYLSWFILLVASIIFLLELSHIH